MPYRHAHWWLLALFPIIVVAFWPGYFGQLTTASPALHAHGITATAWLVLLTLQSWSIHSAKPAWHRAAGLATFVVLPLFAAAGPWALQDMAGLWRTNADPFHATYGPQLVTADMIAGPSVIVLVVYAFRNRRRVRAHAAGMLATALLVMPPILGRLFALLPGFPTGGWAGFGGFRLAFHLGQTVTLLLAIVLASRSRSARPAFGFAAVATVAQMTAFETLGRTVPWQRWTILFTDLPTRPMALAAGVAAATLLWWAWRAGPTPAPHSIPDVHERAAS